MYNYKTTASFLSFSFFITVASSSFTMELQLQEDKQLILGDNFESALIPCDIYALGLNKSVEYKFKEYKKFNNKISYYLNKYISLVETLQDLCTEKSRDQLNNIIANAVYNEVDGLQKKYGDKFIDQLFDSPAEIPAFMIDNIKGIILQIIINLPGLEGIKEIHDKIFINENKLYIEGESVDIQRGLFERVCAYPKSCVKSVAAKHAAPFIAHAFYKMDIAGRLQENVFEELLDRVLQRKEALIKMLNNGITLINEEMQNIDYKYKSIDTNEMCSLVENYNNTKSKVDEAFGEYNKYRTKIKKDEQKINEKFARLKIIEDKINDTNKEIEAWKNPSRLQKAMYYMPGFLHNNSIVDEINKPEISKIEKELADKNHELKNAKIEVEKINERLAKFKNIQDEITRITREIAALENPNMPQKAWSYACSFIYDDYVINKKSELEKKLIDKNNELEAAKIDEEEIIQSHAELKRIQDEDDNINKELIELKNQDKEIAVNKLEDYRTIKMKEREKAKTICELSEVSLMAKNPQQGLNARLVLFRNAENEENDVERKIIVIQEYAYNFPMLQAANIHLNDGLKKIESLEIQNLENQGKLLERLFPDYINPCQQIQSEYYYDWALYLASKPTHLYLNWFGAIEPLLSLEKLFTKDLLGVMDKTCCTVYQMSVTYNQKANGLIEYLVKALSLAASAVDLGMTYNAYCGAINREIENEKLAINEAASYPGQLIAEAYKSVEDYYCDYQF